MKNATTQETRTPLLSVIVPVYGTEKWLRRCLDSIIWQSYRNIELICVNDASPDGCAGILEAYANSDPRIPIKVITHEQNKGLFAARLSGIRAAKGEYIAFVDSDDYVSCDWFRLLISAALKESADIVIGQWEYEDREGKHSYLNLDPIRTPFKLKGEDIIDIYLKQQGSCFSWQLVWNKLYNRRLFEQAFNDLQMLSNDSPKFTMCEDMAFSIAIWIRANRVINIIAGAQYFYCQNETQSTNMSKTDLKEIDVKFKDVVNAFHFMEKELKDFNLFEKYKDDFEAWKIHYAKTYYRNSGANIEYARKIKKSLELEDKIELRDDIDDSFFYSIQSVIGDSERWLNEIKVNICYGKAKVISFDVFDTLLVRPFFYPTDLFCLLNDELINKMGIKSFVDFSKIRIEAEKNCRKRICNTASLIEDITLDEIYCQIESDYNFPKDVLDFIKKKELELEAKYCYPREMGKQLFDLAKEQGKIVIFTSDMYLPEKFVETLLKKNGFIGDKLYISSSIRLTKHTKNLYKFISKDLKVEPQYFLHIGDNWQSDIDNAHECGWEASHLAKPVDMIRNSNPGIYSGEAFNDIYNNVGLMQDTVNTFEGFLGLRCAAGLIANKMYDNPYVTIHKESNYDANPYRVGYAALGPYLLAVTAWIVQNVKEKGSSSVQFVARDGYLPMQAYELFKEYDPTLPTANYLYVSRKSLCLVDIYTKQDLYSIINKLNIFASSPKKLTNLFKKYLTCDEEKIRKAAGFTTILYEQNFSSRLSYELYLKVLGEYIDFRKIQEEKKIIKQYFSKIIPQHSLMFDIGYSGRAELALADVLGYPIDSMYIHSNNDLLNNRMKQGCFKNVLFYGYKPRITGVIREHVFMKRAPSVVGYDELNGEIIPVFEKCKINASTDVITRIVQEAALQFVNDFLCVFAEKFKCMSYRKEDMALPFEYYLHYSKDIDRRIFKCISFEDDLGLGKKVNAYDFWNNEIKITSLNIRKQSKNVQEDRQISGEQIKVFDAPVTSGQNNLNHAPRWKRAIYYFLFDRKSFWAKLKGRNK